MGTMIKPGQYDCLSKLKPDEPYFVLMARDPHAAALVRAWAEMRRAAIQNGIKPPDDRNQVEEALTCADHMDAYRYLRERQGRDDNDD
jgi:hypothetical protein